MWMIIKKIGLLGTLGAALVLASLAGSQYGSRAQGVSVTAQDPPYRLLPGAASSPPTATVPVTEVFGYFCPHCFHLIKPLSDWEMSKPPYERLDLMPVIWRGQEATQQYARLYYTLQALNQEPALHAAVFHEVHVEHHLLVDPDQAKAEVLQTAFAVRHGIEAAAFTRAYHSAEVQQDLERAESFALRNQVLSVPTFIVADKYSADVGTAGGEPQLFSLINTLAAREHL